VAIHKRLIDKTIFGLPRFASNDKKHFCRPSPKFGDK